MDEEDALFANVHEEASAAESFAGPSPLASGGAAASVRLPRGKAPALPAAPAAAATLQKAVPAVTSGQPDRLLSRASSGAALVGGSGAAAALVTASPTARAAASSPVGNNSVASAAAAVPTTKKPRLTTLSATPPLKDQPTSSAAASAVGAAAAAAAAAAPPPFVLYDAPNMTATDLHIVATLPTHLLPLLNAPPTSPQFRALLLPRVFTVNEAGTTAWFRASRDRLTANPAAAARYEKLVAVSRSGLPRPTVIGSPAEPSFSVMTPPTPQQPKHLNGASHKKVKEKQKSGSGGAFPGLPPPSAAGTRTIDLALARVLFARKSKRPRCPLPPRNWELARGE